MDCTSEDQLLLARLEDAAMLSEKQGYPHFVGFLDERQRMLAATQYKRFLPVNICFFGGYEDAERTLLGFFPDDLPIDTASFPLAALTFCYRREASLQHRDFLGTLVSAGVRRDKIGDILCLTGKTVAFVAEDVAPFLASEIRKVGGEGVTVQVGIDTDFSFERRFRDVQMTVASPRLDNVVKALTGVSREKAAADIQSGLVSLNHQSCQSVSKTVNNGDLLSIRGAGRFRVVSLFERTKKGRLILQAQKYL